MAALRADDQSKDDDDGECSNKVDWGGVIEADVTPQCTMTGWIGCRPPFEGTNRVGTLTVHTLPPPKLSRGVAATVAGIEYKEAGQGNNDDGMAVLYCDDPKSS
jgi:hypothetical protein